MHGESCGRRSILFGLQPKVDEPMTASLLRASLVHELGLLGDEEVVKTCGQNFENYLKDQSKYSGRSAGIDICRRHAVW